MHVAFMCAYVVHVYTCMGACVHMYVLFCFVLCYCICHFSWLYHQCSGGGVKCTQYREHKK